MKDNVIYIKFRHEDSKKNFIALLKRLFTRNYTKSIVNNTSTKVIKLKDFDRKRIL